MSLPGFSAVASLGSRTQSQRTGNGWYAPSNDTVLAQSGCYNLCCPSGDCDTTCCADGNGAHVECNNGKANAVCNGCFLTSACVRANGLPDDCEELTIMRGLRDGYLLQQPTGESLVNEYYRIAPAICERIDARQDAFAVYEKIYEQLVRPVVLLVKAGYNAAAVTLYQSVTLELRREVGLAQS